MTHYLDTSVVVALLLQDTHSLIATSWCLEETRTLVVSDFCAAEFAAVVSRRVRLKLLTESDARRTFEEFDYWRSNSAQAVQCTPEHMTAAERTIRDLRTKLTAPDAIHLMIARQLGTDLITFDNRLAEAARLQGVPVLVPS